MSKMSGWNKLKHLPKDDPRRVHALQYAKENLARKGGRKRTPEEAKIHARRMALRHQYGLSESQYDALSAAQEHTCAICKRPERTRASKGTAPKRLAVDHRHDTQQYVRGLLCHSCNIALGLFEDNVTYLASAITYLHTRNSFR